MDQERLQHPRPGTETISPFGAGQLRNHLPGQDLFLLFVVLFLPLGFIKFGSRVDLLLPLGTEINVKLGQ